MNGRVVARSLVLGLLAFGLQTAPVVAQEDDALLDTGELTPQQQIEAAIQQGQQQFSDGEFDAAVSTFSAVVSAYERAGAFAPGPLLLRAKTFAQLEDYQAAIEDLKKALQYAQNQPQILPEIQNTRAEVYMKVGAWQLAYADLQAATQANRSNPQYQFNLGKVLLNLGGPEPADKALTKYLDALDQQEELPEAELTQKAEALRLRGQARGALRKFDDAEADLQASLEIEPDAYEAFYTRSQIELVQKNYAGAVEYLQLAIDKYEPANPDDKLPFVQGYLTRASVFEEMGKEAAREGDEATATAHYASTRDECVKLLEMLPEDDPRALQVQVAAMFRQGVAERLLGELADAVKSFSKALQIDPNQGEAYFRRGICFHFLGEERLAIRDFEQAASINFDSPRANLWQGMSWAKLGDYGQAIRSYGESIAVSDRYTPAYVNRGLAHLAQGEYAKAIDDMNEAIRLQPTEATHYYRRGKAQALAGQYEKAIQSFMNAIEFDATMRPAYDALIDELEASGQSALANEYRTRAAQIGL